MSCSNLHAQGGNDTWCIRNVAGAVAGRLKRAYRLSPLHSYSLYTLSYHSLHGAKFTELLYAVVSAVVNLWIRHDKVVIYGEIALFVALRSIKKCINVENN